MLRTVSNANHLQALGLGKTTTTSAIKFYCLPAELKAVGPTFQVFWVSEDRGEKSENKIFRY